MNQAFLLGRGWALAPISAVGATSSRDLEVFATLVIAACCLFLLAAGVHVARKRRRQRLVRDLLVQQRSAETTKQGLFTGRRAHEPVTVTPDAGKPQTVVSAGRIVYTRTGDVIRFGSTMEGHDDGMVTAAVARDAERQPPVVPVLAPALQMQSYAVERVIAMHDSGVAMLAVGRDGQVVRGNALEPELLVLLEELLEEARWSSAGTASGVHGDRAVTVCRGGELHLAAVLDGDGDERLDRELRRAIGDLRSSPAWSLAHPRTPVERQAGWVALRDGLTRVLGLTPTADPARSGAFSRAGDLRVTTSVAFRGGLVEYIVGVVNLGQGSIYDVQLLPKLDKDGTLEILTSLAMEIDASGTFIIREVPEASKVSATFVFRPINPGTVRIDCSVVYLRGLMSVQDVRPPGRWVEVAELVVGPGEQVEPERALELAIDPSAFIDRCLLYLPGRVDARKLLDDCVDRLRQDMRLVAQVEDPGGARVEAWFHGELTADATLAMCLALWSHAGVFELFVASTTWPAVPSAMLMLRTALSRSAGGPLTDALDRASLASVKRPGFLLEDSWGMLPSR